MKSFFKKNQNSDAIMLRSFLLLITTIIVVFSVILVIAIGHQLLETSRTTADNIVTSLEKTVIDGNHDWKQWRFNSTLDTSTSYVQIHNTRTTAKTKHYYSPGTQKLLTVQPRRIPLIHDLYYQKNTGFLLFKTGHAKGIDYNLWIKLQSQIKILVRIMLVTFIILLLTLITLPLYIHVITQRLTGSLTKLTHASQKISAENFKGAKKLPVPASPTEVKQLAQSFNHLLDNLYYQNNKEKIFVANAAHELRTPIATIQSHAQLIKRHGQQHPEIINDSLTYIYQESTQMADLIEKLLTLSRADQMRLPLKNYNLSQSLQSIGSKFQKILPQKMELVLPPGITAVADQQTVEQIVANLLTNASKYSPANSVVTLILKQSPQQTTIQICDQGMGISFEEKKHIFERFYRSNNVRGSVAGTGLGLAIAAQLAALNQLKLTVSDNVPHGSIFSLIFEKRN